MMSFTRSLSRQRLIRVVLPALALLPLAASADGGRADLVNVYVKALDANPGYQEAIAGFREAVEAKPQALSKLLPQISAAGGIAEIEQAISGQYFVGIIDTGTGDGINVKHRDEFHEINYEVQVTQVLFDWALFKQYDEAELQVGQAGIRMYEALDQLRLTVAQAYFAALEAQDGIGFAAAEKDAVGQLFEQTRTRNRSGLATDADLKQADAEYQLSAVDYVQARNNLDIALSDLQMLTGGESYTELKSLPKDYELTPPDPDRVGQWIEHALKQNLSVQEKHYGTEIAGKEIERVRAQRLPVLDLGGRRQFGYADGGISHGISVGDNHELDERAYLTLKIPIYDGGAINSGVRAATAGYERAQLEEDGARNSARHDTQLAFLNSTTALRQVAALQLAVQSAAAAEDAARVGYDVGTKTYSDVLIALRSRYKAERDYSQARYGYLSNFLKLKQASGTLSHADILSINRSLR